jgi:phosphate:Na+ symporter
MVENLNKHNYDVDIKVTETVEKKINEFRNKLRSQHVHDIENENYPYQIGTLYKDIFSESEKIGDYIYDVTLSIVDSVN